MATFGLRGFEGGKLIINARSETAYEKPLFSESLQKRRLVLPATGFYEWEHKDGRPGRKFLFSIPGRPLFYLCGFYQVQDKGRFCILTREANESMRQIHDRMPVIARPHEVRPFLTDLDFARELFKAPAPELISKAQLPEGGVQLSFQDL